MTTSKPTEIREWTIQYVNQSCSWWVISYPIGNEIERTSISPPFVRVIEKIAYEQLKAAGEKLSRDIDNLLQERGKLREQVKDYEQLQKEISFLKQIIQRQNTELEMFHGMTFSENQEILKLREQVNDYEQALKTSYEQIGKCAYSNTDKWINTLESVYVKAREVLKKWDKQ